MSQHLQKCERRDVDCFGVVDQASIILYNLLSATVPSFYALEIHQLKAKGSPTEPGAALFSPLMPPAVASMRFNRSILRWVGSESFLILPWRQFLKLCDLSV